ncbi:MAG: amidohydrolase family protein [Candidatus Aminicenantes bacterium]|nr:MAG: amidohydrolase family protein [Candidatus Aminicenantes bacterium]
MRKFLCCLIFFSLSLLPLKAAEINTDLIYLTGGNLLDVSEGKTIPNALVIIEKNTITYAGPAKTFEKSPEITMIDCSGKTILPGLFDAHIHLGGASTLGYILIDEGRKLSAFLYSGVTSVFDLGAPPDWIFSIQKAEKSKTHLSPRVFSVGPVFTSPSGHGTEYGVPMSMTPTTEKEAREAVQKLIKENPDHIKIIYEKGSKHFTSLSYELMETIIDEARKNNFPVVTHIITLEHAKDALEAGTDGFAHMVTDQEVPQNFLAEMKRKNVYCIPTLAVFESFSGKMVGIKESLEGPLTKQGISREIIADLVQKTQTPGIEDHLNAWSKTLHFAKINAKKMSDLGIKLAVGTDAGNPAVFFGHSVHREMELMVEAGISPAKVIQAATINAAEILGQGEKLGTISAGKLADILVVEGNPLDKIQNTQNIVMVIKNGKILDREELALKINPPEDALAQPENKTETSPTLEMNSTVKTQIIEAKSLLKKGVNTWDPELMKKARNRLLGLMAGEKTGGFYSVYYIALCDYRLATYYLTQGQLDRAEPYIKEGQDYLKKAMELEPDIGELDAFYAYMLGFEIALNPEKAMSLGFETYKYFGKAFEKSPENPRVHYLKGASDLYTPEQYGGGADAAIKTLTKSIDLFEKENVEDPVKPSWGKDEAYTFLGMAYNQKGDKSKAAEYFTKALEVNPEFGMAKDELEKIKK